MGSDLRLQTGDLKERGLNVEARENLTCLWPPPFMEQVGDYQKETGPSILAHGKWKQSLGFPPQRCLWSQFTATCLDTRCWARESSSPQLPKPSPSKSKPAEGQNLLLELGVCRFVPKSLFIQQRITVPCTVLPTRKLSSPPSPRAGIYRRKQD